MSADRALRRQVGTAVATAVALALGLGPPAAGAAAADPAGAGPTAAAGAGPTAAAGAGPTAAAGARPTAASAGAVSAWAARHAHPLASTDPGAPLRDLAPLRRSIGAARIVALGEAPHGAAEETTLKHRTLRLLVERVGVRTVAWEEDWTTGVEIDAYIHGAPQDLAQLTARMSPQYQTQEVAGVLAWLRRFNAGRRDQVSFFGVEYYFTRRLAYDTVERYVAATAPRRLGELRRHLTPLRPPPGDDPFEHIDDYSRVEDKRPYLDDAHAVHDLVARLPHHLGERAHAIALHAATQIVSWHEHYAMTEAANTVYREARAADSLRWWQQLTGTRTAYWAASAHTANAPDLRIVRPGGTDLRFASAGSYLRRWYGDGYRSIGFTVDHGTVGTGPGQTVDLAPPAPGWFEAPLGAVPYAAFTLDLHTRPVPGPVRHWLHDPVVTRGLPDAGPASVIDGGTLAEWFDVLVDTRTVHPATFA
jgi:erythromycin esterase-like protein